MSLLPIISQILPSQNPILHLVSDLEFTEEFSESLKYLPNERVLPFGLKCAPALFELFATAINYLLSDVKFRKKLGKSAYETIKNKFFINKIYKDFEKFY